MYRISGCIRFQLDIQPLFTILFRSLTVKKLDNETRLFYFTGHHKLKHEICDSVVIKTCWDGPGAVLSETVSLSTAPMRDEINTAMSEFSTWRHLWKPSRNRTLKFKTMLPENLLRQKDLTILNIAFKWPHSQLRQMPPKYNCNCELCVLEFV